MLIGSIIKSVYSVYGFLLSLALESSFLFLQDNRRLRDYWGIRGNHGKHAAKMQHSVCAGILR